MVIVFSSPSLPWPQEIADLFYGLFVSLTDFFFIRIFYILWNFGENTTNGGIMLWTTSASPSRV